MQRPSNQCPSCGGETTHKQVDKVLRGGNDTAVLSVEADVCLKCGERLYGHETVQRFEQIREKLQNHDTADLTPIGQAFQVN